MTANRRKLRLGGMALRNGLLVHGPTHWAAAVRTDDGEIKVASGRKPRAARRRRRPGRARRRAARRGVRGDPARQARRCPRRGCRSRTPPCSASPPARRSPARSLRRRLRGAGGEAAAALISLAPGAVRAARRRARRLPRRRAQGDRRLRGRTTPDAADAAKEHERCGSHLVAPMLASNLAGTLLLRRVARAPGPAGRRRGRARLDRRGRRGVRLVRAQRRDARSPARCAARASRSSALVGTREPDERQLEVGRAALAEILRVGGRRELGPREWTRRRRPEPAVHRRQGGHCDHMLHRMSMPADPASPHVVRWYKVETGSSPGPRSSSWGCSSSSSGGR